MSHEVKLSPAAQKDLDKFRGTMLDRVEEAVIGLAEDPRHGNAIKLSGTSNKWRIRVGNYRVCMKLTGLQKQ